MTLIEQLKIIINSVLAKENLQPSAVTYKTNGDGTISIYLTKLLVLKVCEKNKTYLVISKSYLNTINLPKTITLENLKTLTRHSRLIINEPQLSEDIIIIIRHLIIHYLTNMYSEPFGCCSKYIECSNDKHCLHKDLLISKGCSYRKNLENGKYFMVKIKMWIGYN